MKTRKEIIGLSIILLVFISSCIPSLHPLYTEKDIVEDDRLLGEWIIDRPGDDEIHWEIKKGGSFSPRQYDLRVAEKGDTVEMQLTLLKIEDNYYFDFYVNHFNVKNTMKELHRFPVHTFAKVEVNNEELIVHQFDGYFFDKLIKENKVRISHEDTGSSGMILTASTDELQKFVGKYGDNEEMYVDSRVIKRVN